MKRSIVIVIAGTIGLMLTSCAKNQQTTADLVVPVRTYTVKMDSISTFLEIPANLEAENEAQVYSMISEKLTHIAQKVGSAVKKDEIIAVMENRIWKEALNQAEASLQSIQARHEQVKQDYERYQRLYQEKAVSLQQWEQIRSSMQEAEANLARLKAAYAQALEQYNNTFIKAPFDGIVGSIYFDEGQMIPVNQPVVKIVTPQLMKSKLYVPNIQIGKINVGQAVFAHFPAFAQQTFIGRINQIDPAIDPLSRTVRVEAIFENINNMLKSGMFGLFNIEMERRTNTVVIPDNAVLNNTEVKIDPQTGSTYTEKSYYVFVVKDDTVRLVNVETGLNSHDRTEILQGLVPGDQVIVVGQKVVKEGERVQIITD